MKVIVIIALTHYNLAMYGQDLRFVVNTGHHTTITYFEEGLNGTNIFTASESEIIKREVYSGRVLFRHTAEGKFEAVSLSDDLGALVAFENGITGNFIHIWDAITDKLLKSIDVKTVVSNYVATEVKAIRYFKAAHLLVWVTREHVYFFDLAAGKVRIDPGLKEGGRFIREAAFSKSRVTIYGMDYQVQNVYSFSAIDITSDPAKVNPIAPTPYDSMVGIYALPGTDTLALLKWREVDLLDIRTGNIRKIPFANSGFTATYNASFRKVSRSNHLQIASNGRLLDINLSNDQTKVTAWEYVSFDRSAFSLFNSDILFTGGDQKLFKLSLKAGEIVKWYDDVRIDNPANMFLTTDNKLICESNYTNTTCNVLDLDNLAFEQVTSRHMNDSYGKFIQKENVLVKILVDYSNNSVRYFITNLYIGKDSIERIDLHKILPQDSLEYPRLELSADYRHFFVFSKKSVYAIDRKSKKLSFQFSVPSRQSGFNNRVKRPVLFLKDHRYMVIGDLNILIYDLNLKKIVKVVKDDPEEYQPYFDITLNHDSSKILYRKNYWLYSFDIASGETDTVGYFRWLYEFSPLTINNARYWALGYENGKMEIRSENLNTVIREAKIHEGRIKQFLYDSSKKRLISAGSDGFLSFIDAETLKPELKGCFLTTGGYKNTSVFLINDSNQYYLSANLTNAVHVVFENKAYDYTSLDPLLNRPDVIAKALNANENVVLQLQAAYKLRKERLGIKERSRSQELPKCWILNKERFPYITDSSRLLLSVKYHETKYRVKRIFIKDNNILVKSVALPVNAKASGEMVLPLILSAKSNHIQVYAEDSFGNKSLYESLDIEYKQEKYDNGRLIFIGIGLTNYSDTSRSLTFGAKDVLDVAHSFKKAGYNDDIILTLIDSGATAKCVRQLRTILENTRPEDKVIIYFSGHGARTDKGFLFCLYETDFKDIPRTAFSFEEFAGLFENVSARKRLIFIDACQSGDVISSSELNSLADSRSTNGSQPDGNKNRSEILEFYNSYFANFSSDNGLQVVAASYGEDAAVERLNLGNGIFTFCFKKGLFEKQAFPGTAYIPKGTLYPDLAELRKYLYDAVGAISHGGQLPSTVFLDPYNEWDFEHILLNL